MKDNTYKILGLLLAEAIGYSIEEDRMADIRASAERTKEKRMASRKRLRGDAKNKDPKSKQAKVDKEINKAMGKAKVGYTSKTSGKKGVAGLAHDIQTGAKEKLEAHKKKQQELIDKESEG